MLIGAHLSLSDHSLRLFSTTSQVGDDDHDRQKEQIVDEDQQQGQHHSGQKRKHVGSDRFKGFGVVVEEKFRESCACVVGGFGVVAGSTVTAPIANVLGVQRCHLEKSDALWF